MLKQIFDKNVKKFFQNTVIVRGNLTCDINCDSIWFNLRLSVIDLNTLDNPMKRVQKIKIVPV